MSGATVGEAARIDNSMAGDLWSVRRDLEEGLSHVRNAWAADTEGRLTSVTYGLEALLRATSVLTRIVEQMGAAER